MHYLRKIKADPIKSKPSLVPLLVTTAFIVGSNAALYYCYKEMEKYLPIDSTVISLIDPSTAGVDSLPAVVVLNPLAK